MYGETSPAANIAARPMPELGRLKAAAERVGIAQHKISNFLDRFHGPIPTGAVAGGVDVPADSYRNDLETLFIAIERLENVVSALDGIG